MAAEPATLTAANRSPRTRRANRAALLLVGVILLLAGAAGFAAGLGAFGSSFATQHLLPSTTRGYADRNGSWFWPVVGLVGVVVALPALRWLAIQLRSNRIGQLDLVRDRHTGNTTVAARAVCDALAAEIAAYPGVDAAGAQLIGSPRHPTLLVRVRLDGRNEISDVRQRIETDGVPHLRQALDNADLPARVELTLPAREARAVR